jgi:hypothetical protein
MCPGFIGTRTRFGGFKGLLMMISVPPQRSTEDFRKQPVGQAPVLNVPAISGSAGDLTQLPASELVDWTGGCPCCDRWNGDDDDDYDCDAWWWSYQSAQALRVEQERERAEALQELAEELQARKAQHRTYAQRRLERRTRGKF